MDQLNIIPMSVGYAGSECLGLGRHTVGGAVCVCQQGAWLKRAHDINL